ncbi:MAG TPA: S8 family serine peptidase [Xanthomonadaceae bacterium]|nr:S8 family serine peptidase [Xanthomonadaceae bacterium]
MAISIRLRLLVALAAALGLIQHATAETRSAYYLQLEPDVGHARIEAEISAAGGQVTHDLARVHTLAVLLPEAATAALAAIEGVRRIEPVPSYHPLSQFVPWHVDQVQARDVWDENRDGTIDFGAPDGTGVRICMIDTGVFAQHPDLAGVRISGMSQISGESWNEDGAGHGTRVAGIIAARHNDLGVVGIAPGGLELLVVKFFNNDGVFVPGESNLAAAVEWCRDEGAHVINLSLGTPAFSDVEQTLFEELYLDHGILSIAGAGNTFAATRSYPASYEGVISVAGLNDAAVHLAASAFPDSDFDPDDPPAAALWDVVELAAGADPLLSTQAAPPADVPRFQVTVNGATRLGVQIDESALGEVSAAMVDGGLCAEPDPDAWAGHIVLCERGAVTFAIKINAVRTAGGLGVVIYNHNPGNFRGSCNGNCDQPSLPTLSLSQADGQALLAAVGKNATLLVDDGSDCTDCVGGYGYLFSGFTSQAAAVASGAAALLWSACGGKAGISHIELREVLRDSALALAGTSANGDEYGVGWDPYTGWGLLQLRDALDLARSRFGDRCRQSFCASATRQIPDGDAAGIDDALFPVQTAVLADLDVSISARHGWPGDLVFRLEHMESGTSALLIDRPGVPASTFGCSEDDIDLRLDDEGDAGPVEDACPLDTGLSYTPDQPLAAFNGLPFASEWRLTAIDEEADFEGTLESWCLHPTRLLAEHIFGNGFESGN